MKSKEEKFDPSWNECSPLDEWIEKMLRQGYTEIVKSMVSVLPDASKEKYREMWRRIAKEKMGEP